LILFSSPASAIVSTGPGGTGVTAGNSSLFTTPDYSDTFTQTAQGGPPGRPDTAAPQPLIPAYIVESNYGNASRIFSTGAGFSFASDTAGLVNGSPAYPGGTTAGSATGITQTGGGVDYAIPYGLREEYVVQVDAVQTGDRIDISSGGAPGIFAANSLSVFFRGDGSGNASLFNGTTDTPIQASIPGFNTGIPGGAGTWHNYAVRYDRPGNEIEIFVDEVSKGIIDLTTFGGGVYQGFSNAWVGAGAGMGAGNNRTWTDNFQVGGTGPVDHPLTDHPNPGPLANLPAGLLHFWDFNEADGPQAGRTLNLAYDRQGARHGFFVGIADRAPGLVGTGSALFHDAAGEGVAFDGNGLTTPNGITIETLFSTTYDGSDQAEFLRKEDGGNRILLSFQSDGNTNNAFGQLVGSDAGFPGISLGLNTAGYKEMDVALDGADGRPSLASLTDGSVHHLVASYDAATGVKAMYIDGVQVALIDGPDNVPIVNGGAATGFIGSTNGGEPFPGILDEVAVYSRALSPAEIALHFQNFQSGQNYFIPEPGTWALAAAAMALLLARASRRRKRA
jgi:hypothetical protein